MTSYKMNGTICRLTEIECHHVFKQKENLGSKGWYRCSNCTAPELYGENP